MVALQDLIRSGQLLELGCYACKRHAYIDASCFDVPSQTPSFKVCDAIACPACGVRNAEPGFPLWSRPDARPPTLALGRFAYPSTAGSQ